MAMLNFKKKLISVRYKSRYEETVLTTIIVYLQHAFRELYKTEKQPSVLKVIRRAVRDLP